MFPLFYVSGLERLTKGSNSANLAFKNGWGVFVSHRSGETIDDFIADLTVGLRTGHLKTGAPCRGERVAKYNRLMDIEDEIKTSEEEVTYAGANFRKAYGLGGENESKAPLNVFGY